MLAYEHNPGTQTLGGRGPVLGGGVAGARSVGKKGDSCNPLCNALNNKGLNKKG